MDSLVNVVIELCKLDGWLTVPPNLDLKPAHQSVCSQSEKISIAKNRTQLAF